MSKPSETFRWHRHIFNVAKINEAIRDGTLSGKRVTLPRPSIEWFARNILGLEDRSARLLPGGPLIDADYAKSLNASRLSEPIVLARIQRIQATNELSAGLDAPGALHFEPFSASIVQPVNSSTADIVLIDGNHRLASAYYQNIQSMDGWLLWDSQTDKYMTDER